MAEKNDFISDDDLDRMLTRLGAEVPAPSDDLMARIMADAEALRPIPGALIAGEPEGFFESFLSLLGGWKGAGGLVSAGIIGLWIGVSPPSTLESTTTDLWDMISPDVTGGWSDFDDFL